MVDRHDAAIQHGVTCPCCGNETYKFEKHCHHCGINRWSYPMTRVQVTHVYEIDLNLEYLEEYVENSFLEDDQVQIRNLESGEEVYERI